MRSAPSPTHRGNTPFGIIRPAPGRRTGEYASTICCCRRKPATASSMSGSTAMCAAGRSRRTTSRFGRTLIWKWPEAKVGGQIHSERFRANRTPVRVKKTRQNKEAARASVLIQSEPMLLWARKSVALALHPVLKHLQRHGPVVVGSLGNSAVVTFLDPDFVRTGAIASQGQPHQAARSLARQAVAVEQHLNEQGLRFVLSLLRRKTQPARAIAEVVARSIGSLEVEPRQIVLRVRITEIGRGIGEHFACAIRVRLDLGIGDTVQVIAPERDKGV